MPLPLFYVLFHQNFGRDPRPDELSFTERDELMKDCIANLTEAWKHRLAKDVVAKLRESPDDPDLWHELLRHVQGPIRSELQRLRMRDRSKFIDRLEITADFLDTFFTDGDPDKWISVICRSVLGIDTPNPGSVSPE
ncbi:MAG: hypothetical protein K0U16_07670 [Gammaproteobacteria bacterium]|nr:hypothetical protein [Gammaproteobacteria bacterium]